MQRRSQSKMILCMLFTIDTARQPSPLVIHAFGTPKQPLQQEKPFLILASNKETTCVRRSHTWMV